MNDINTPLGTIYGGRAALGNDIATAYLGLDRGNGNTYSMRLNRFGDGLNSGSSPTYALGLNFPDNAPIPNYYFGDINTPLGTFGAGTNDGNKNINFTYQPSDAAQNLYNALIQNYMNRR